MLWHEGPTDVRALVDSASDILDKDSPARTIGRCRLVPRENPAGPRRIEVWDGTRLVAVFDSCNGEIRDRGITDGTDSDAKRAPILVGDRAEVLASDALVCRGIVGRAAVSCAVGGAVSYEVPAKIVRKQSQYVSGTTAKLLVAGKHITSIARVFCD